mmetsp:Transcript_86201/g.155264  ORF Transcript_86201/g.155264 Transcript_86201/m.155264 type:complete len:557 (+) Transcript_86201:60-1730(+)
MKALVVVQCFPPLLKNAGGVSKRYFTLCRALIDGLGWQVTLMTPVNVNFSQEPDIQRWLEQGSLVHLAARGVRCHSATDGVAVFLDLFSFVNAGALLKELVFFPGRYDCVFMDDVPWRIELLLLTRAMGVPSVVSTHTDITHMNAFKGTVKLVWKIHLLSTHLATVHATVSRVFGDQMRKMYQVPIDAIWPPILWSQEFKSEPSVWEEQAAATRAIWLEKLGAQGCVPKAIMLFAGRWSSEKRIHLLWEAVPRDCALVIVGDGTSEYCQTVLNAGPVSGRPNVLPMRKMLSGKELRVAYAACDLFLSASNFETLGNTVIEAMCSGTPCALQPAQGHLEFVVDKKNSWFVDYDDTVQARATLSQIVAGGLDGKALETVLPDLAPLGKKFRTGNFAQDFDEVVLHKALAPQSRGVFGWLLEIVKRVCAMVTCFILFFIWRGFTRYAFITSREPQFEVLGQLGGAVDDKLCSSVWTLPCMRRPYNNVKEFLAWISGCRDASRTVVAEPASPRAAARQAADATDYESHYKSARRRNSAVLDVFQAGAGGVGTPSKRPRTT